ncbi:alanine racemase [Oscillibacter sp.]|uniref:alanine racemase n=1 Tax=Oscillibacter sp. TaxID=1945593 RepID=UPI002898C64D|nr:alanine racemase [Oscillibacter sp.]
MEKFLKRTWAEIDLDALAHNYRTIRERMGPKSKYLGVVKADAYGHGAVWVAKKLERLGAEYLGVSNLEEAQELRHNGLTLPILLLGYTPADMTEALIHSRVTQDVPSLEMARAYSAAAAACGKTLTVHLKLDTGMGRLGFRCDEAYFEKSLEEILEALKLPNLVWEGVFMHFCVSDEPDKEESRAFTRAQYDRFSHMVNEVESRAGMQFSIHHCCNSGGVAFYPEYAWDMCRPGVILFGTEPMSRTMGLKPVMTLKTTVGPVKDYAPETSVSYGRTYFTEGEQRIGVLPIGYADGLQRCLSNRWEMLTPKGPAKIRGRVCMDMCMVDLTDLPDVHTGDEVEVFGPNNLVEKMAEAAGTITYELTCDVSKRVPRVYLENGEMTDRHLQLLL